MFRKKNRAPKGQLFVFQPLEDITTFELAQIVAYITPVSGSKFPMQVLINDENPLPSDLERHFKFVLDYTTNPELALATFAPKVA